MTKTQIALSEALPGDAAELRAFIAAAGLPVDDVQPGAQQYLLAREGGRLVGTVGLEVVGSAALARSLAVAADRRGEGIGEKLLEALAERALSQGIKVLYSLTITAERYATARGFERIDRRDVPPGIVALAQFRSLCPVSAVCLRRSL
jgi:amino-acid N-acetyltransferase